METAGRSIVTAMESNRLVYKKPLYVMFTPTACGGHTRYSTEVLRGLANSSAKDALDFLLVTSEDSCLLGRMLPFRLAPILPKLRHRTEYKNKLSWVIARAFHYIRRDTKFLYWLATQNNVRVIHFQEMSPITSIALSYTARFIAKAKIVGTVHNITPHTYHFTSLRYIIDFLLKITYRSFDYCVFHTDTLRQAGEAFIKSSNVNYITAPHGTWTIEERQQTNIPDNSFGLLRILAYGNIRRNKNIHLLIKSLSLITSFKVHLRVAGPAGDKEYLHEIEQLASAANSGQRHRVSIQPNFICDDEVHELMAHSDVLALPYTNFSSQSGILFDALAYRRPIIATEQGGLKDVMTTHKIGVLIHSADEAGIADAIKQFYATDRAQFANGLDEAARSFSWRTHAESIITAMNIC